MKFLRLHKLLVNLDQVRTFQLKDFRYEEPSTCSITYIDGTTEEVLMDEKEFKEVTARLDNFRLLIR